MIDYGRFSERFQNQSTKWELMKAFLQEWNLYEEGAETVAEQEIKEAEISLGKLPHAFKEWLQLSYNPFFINPKLFWTWLVFPTELELWAPETEPHRKFLVFKQEYQQCCEWAFSAEDLTLNNPPVYWGSTWDGFLAEDWLKQANHFSDFMLHLLIVRSVTGARYYAESNNEVLLQRVKEKYINMGLPTWYEYGDTCQLWGGSDVVILLDSKPPWGDARTVRLASRSLEGLQKAKELLAVEWDYWSIAGNPQPIQSTQATKPDRTAKDKAYLEMLQNTVEVIEFNNTKPVETPSFLKSLFTKFFNRFK